ncbi:MAG: hypothetical protein R3B57_06065 [Phycisphaerales bacterium]
MKKGIITSVALFVVGLAIAVGVNVFLMVRAVGRSSAGVQFAVPGEVVYDAAHAGTYEIDIEIQGLYNGVTHSSSASLPDGAAITVTRVDSGETIPWKPDPGTRTESGATERVGLATFNADSPGEYRISVEGDFPQRVFYVGPGLMGTVMVTLVGGCASGVVGFACVVAGVVVFAVTLSTGAKPKTT